MCVICEVIKFNFEDIFMSVSMYFTGYKKLLMPSIFPDKRDITQVAVPEQDAADLRTGCYDILANTKDFLNDAEK